MFRCACRVCPAHPALLVTRRALRARHDNLRGSDARDGQVASRNRADFRNLMDVYLDAVFHPRAVEDEGWWVLRQEGWRYDAAAGDEDEDDDDGRARDLRGGAPLRGGPPPPGPDAAPGGRPRGDRRRRDRAPPPDRAAFELKGVVYSEMKGAYSDPEGYMDRIAQSLLVRSSCPDVGTRVVARGSRGKGRVVRCL